MQLIVPKTISTHFKHVKDKNNCINTVLSDGETIIHKLSKELIKNYYTQITFNTNCIYCGTSQICNIENNLKPIVEHKYENYRIDCAFIDNDNKLQIAVEIYNTHKTNDIKMLELTKCCTFIEVDCKFAEEKINSLFNRKQIIIYSDNICTKCIPLLKIKVKHGYDPHCKLPDELIINLPNRYRDVYFMCDDVFGTIYFLYIWRGFI